MDSILEEFYFGITPCDRDYKETPEYIRLNKELKENEEKLYKFFDENKNNELEKAFERVSELNNEIASCEKSQRFAEGFSLGVRLVAEAFYYTDAKL